MSSNLWSSLKGLGIAISSLIAFSANCAIAQITPDATLPNSSQVRTQDNIKIIENGTRAGNNLFHSFEQFSVPTGITAYFNNAIDIHNIISRVTGKSVSNIDGMLKANGTANLFLINPNGILFGPNASLNIGGSFVATTASSLNFADGTKFSATNPETTSLLTVSVPIGLQFGATANPIRNQSQVSPEGATNFFASPVGLQVKPGKTLALVGGDVILDGGNLTAPGGRIELGSVAGNSLVSLNSTNQGWTLGYEGVENFQNIQLVQRNQIPSIVDASGEGGGAIQLQSKQVLNDNSQIASVTLGSQPGGDLTVNASESVKLNGYDTTWFVMSLGAGNVGDITINTRKLSVRDGAQVVMNNLGSGLEGQLTVNASDSVELIGGYLSQEINIFFSSALYNATSATGNAGNLTINTGRLSIQGGAYISTESGGRLVSPKELLPATGKGGNLIVNASKSVELTGTSPNGKPSGLSASTSGSGSAGNVTVKTRQLIVRDGATINVGSQVPKEYIYLGDPKKIGKAGEINITADSIFLDNKGKITSETDLGKGGDITLNVQDLLLMRRNSQISTNAGEADAAGDGGNITINAPKGFVVAAPGENNDITANAFTDFGGRIEIKSFGLFNFQPRSREELVSLLLTNDLNDLDPQMLKTNDITAISQASPTLNGQVNINTTKIDPNQGLVELPVNLVDASQKIATGCNAIGKEIRSSFVATGRGGIAPSPTEPLINDTVLADWITLKDETLTRNIQKRETEERRDTKYVQKLASNNPPDQIVEAQGLVVNKNGKVALVANAPTVTPYVPLFAGASCSAQ